MKFQRQNLEEKFKERLAKLNNNQLKAVSTIEGPVIVNAGPGTGKTEVLALRIANILLQPDIFPKDILCLTYTDNGVVEMRNRLLAMIGADAYKINIHTFHSFCNEVIQHNLYYFGTQNLNVLDELEETELFKKLIDSIENDNPLKHYKDIYFERKRLKNLFALMKKENWDEKHFEKKIAEYVDGLKFKEEFIYKKNGKNYKVGDLKQKLIDAEKEKMETLKAAANLYPRYQKLLADSQRYTYDDMLLWVIEAFNKNQNLLQDYQERFLYFLVDEYQDTSGSQNELISLLLSNANWDKPNIFVVGDADQSIYSFQNANVKNILNFEKKHEQDGVIIKLENNYRSSQIILDTAEKLIKNNVERTVKKEDSKPLVASNTLRVEKFTPKIVAYPNPTQEAMDIALQIEELLNKNISAKNIAVIYRNHAQVEELVSFLKQKKIAYNLRKKENVLEHQIIQDVLLILSWIQTETTHPHSSDDILFQLLHLNYFNISSLEIANLIIELNKRNTNKSDKISLRQLLNEKLKEQQTLFSESNKDLKNVFGKLEFLLKEVHNVTVQQFFELVIQQLGLLSYSMQQPEMAWLLQVLTSFFNFIKELTFKYKDTDLKNLLHKIELMQSDNISIPLYKIDIANDGVNLITAHASKGSEFDYVFLINCNQTVWNKKQSGRNNYSFPDNLIDENAQQKNLVHNSTPIDEDEEESRRLFYVAMTRAKFYLQISFSLNDNTEKKIVPSNFVTEIIEATDLKIEEKQLSQEQIAELLYLHLSETIQPEIRLVEKNYIDDLLQSYSLSVTHLNNYLDCPLTFYYQNLLKVPSAKNEYLVFGNAVHTALQKYFLDMKNNNNEFLPADKLVYHFENYMLNNRESFTPEIFASRMEYGKNVLTNYHERYIDEWNKIVVIEKRFTNVTIADVPVNGMLDKIEFVGKKATVVDYKTGSFKNAKEKLLPPSAANPNGGNYWRQAVFYKLLIKNDNRIDWLFSNAVFDFIEPVDDDYKTVPLDIFPDDEEIVTAQIKDTWQKIQNHEFYTGCGSPDCYWCNFVKKNNLGISKE